MAPGFPSAMAAPAAVSSDQITAATRHPTDPYALLIGNTELDIFLNNQCGRLLALVIIAYSSILLSAVLDKHQASGDQAAIARLRKVSPVAWQSILFLGQYLFHGPRQPIDVDALIATAILS
jgi:hypothetical protein